MKFKKFASLGLAVVLAAGLLTGCGNKKETNAALNLCRFPEPAVDVFIHFGIFDVIVKGKECAFVSILEIIVCPGAGKAQIPVVSSVDYHLHLLVVISPSGSVDSQFYPNFFLGVFVDFFQYFFLIFLSVSDLPPGQLHNLLSAGICFFLVAAAGKKSRRQNYRNLTP